MEALEQRIDAYLARLGVGPPARADLDTLRTLHRSHLERVPFENVDIMRGVPIRLGGPSVDKIVAGQRGGFCYELNGAFAALLTELGFDVTLVQARVYRADGELGIPFDHLCLLVDLGRRHVADVGFGDCFVEPLVLDPGVAQVDPAGTYRIDERGDGWFDLVRNGELQYRFEDHPRQLGEFEAACAHHQSPASHFSRGLVATCRTPDGRITLARRTLIETTDGQRVETEVDADAVHHVLAERFGITVA